MGIVQPRLRALYDWSAQELRLPGLAGLLVGDVPSYTWDPSDRGEWHPPVTAAVRLARHAIPRRGAR